jgi:hypothetical protein
MALTVGQRLTLLKIDPMLAWTHRYEVEVRQVLEPHTVEHHESRQRLALAHDDIVLDGWDLPLRADSECARVIHGNACYNLVGDPAVIRHCLETRATLPVSNDAKAKIIVAREPITALEGEGQLLYPEIDTHHAVINEMKEE